MYPQLYAKPTMNITKALKALLLLILCLSLLDIPFKIPGSSETDPTSNVALAASTISSTQAADFLVLDLQQGSALIMLLPSRELAVLSKNTTRHLGVTVISAKFLASGDILFIDDELSLKRISVGGTTTILPPKSANAPLFVSPDQQHIAYLKPKDFLGGHIPSTNGVAVMNMASRKEHLLFEIPNITVRLYGWLDDKLLVEVPYWNPSTMKPSSTMVLGILPSTSLSSSPSPLAELPGILSNSQYPQTSFDQAYITYETLGGVVLLSPATSRFTVITNASKPQWTQDGLVVTRAGVETPVAVNSLILDKSSTVPRSVPLPTSGSPPSSKLPTSPRSPQAILLYRPVSPNTPVSAFYDQDGSCGGLKDWHGHTWTTTCGSSTGGYWSGHSYDGHEGTDYAGADRDPVNASQTGTVSHVEVNCTNTYPNGTLSYGTYVHMTHGTLGDGNSYQTRYAHLICNDGLVSDETSIQSLPYRIARMGNTGYSSGTHTHLNVYRNGSLIDPYGAGIIGDSPPTTQPPSAPSNLSASATGQNSIRLTWSDNSNNETGFKIFRNGSEIAQVGAGATSYDSTGLSCSTNYSYYVKAYIGTVDSGASNTSNATTSQCPPPPAPSLSSPSNGQGMRSCDSITLDWNDTARATAYYVEYSGTGSGNSGWRTDTQWNIGQRTVGNYSWRVKAKDRFDAEGPWSETRSFTVNPNQTPSTPNQTNPSDGAWVNTRNPALQYNASDDGCPRGLTYNGQIERLPGGTWSGSTTDFNSTTWSPSLPSDDDYRWRVQAYDGSLTGGWSSYRTVRIDTAAPETSITTGTQGDIPTGAASFTWTGSDNRTPTDQLQYSYRLVGKDSNWSSWSGSTTVSYTGLAEGSYSFELKARDLAGNEDGSSATRSLFVDLTAPDTSITAGPIGCIPTSTVAFSWAGTDNRTPSNQLVYSYQLVGYEANWSSFGSATTKNYSNLPDGPYTFKVRARDGVGHVDASPPERVLTVDTKAPQGIILVNGGNSTTNQIAVHLTISATDGLVGCGIDEMRLANDSINYQDWQSFQTSAAWLLPAVDRTNWTVYVLLRDVVGNTSPAITDSIYLDFYPPRPKSTNYQLGARVMASGDGKASSQNYRLKSATEGQPLADAGSGASEYNVIGGFQGSSQTVPRGRPTAERYDIPGQVMASGGSASISTHYRLQGTSGQSVAGQQRSSTHYRLSSGFWFGSGPTGPATTSTPTPTPSKTRTATAPPASSASATNTSTSSTVIATATSTSIATAIGTSTASNPTSTANSTAISSHTVIPSITSTEVSTQVATTTGTPVALNTGTPTKVPEGVPTSCALQFADVVPGSTFYDFVHCLACRQIVSGYGCGGDGEPCVEPNNYPYFRPGFDVTRGQLSKIVSNAAGYGEDYTTATFEDVPVGATFYLYIERLYFRSVISGYPCGGPNEPCVAPANKPYFRTQAKVTRGQTAKIVSNAAEYQETYTDATFEDVPPGSTFHQFVERLYVRNILSGYGCGAEGEPCQPPTNKPYFRVSADVTRGQSSKLVANAFYPNCQTPARSN